ncbi:MAG: MFS transporter [Limisphaerales bacterium]
MHSSGPSTSVNYNYPRGFRARRGLNWVVLGGMYASYYMCRYNFRFATPGMEKEFGFNHADITNMLSAWSIAYGIGQLINGLICDRIGGRTSMVIGAAGTILINFIYGFASFAGTFSTFALIWLFNGYLQSFGSPGMIKINAAWFNRSERGTFAGIFGFMIQLGQVGINKIGPFILAGFTIGTWTLAAGQWRWLFRIPPLITAVMAVLVAFIPRETPEQAGYKGCVKDESDSSTEHSDEVKVSIKECFVTIFKHPLVWFYALAYACTGAVRHSSDQLSVLYFTDHLKVDIAHDSTFSWTMLVVPLVAVAGSIISGVVSDKVFHGHRSPVAMQLYFILAAVLLFASLAMWGGMLTSSTSGILMSCGFLIFISFTVNATHSIVGAAAPMDIGGRKMAGFASGVIDSFQYFGAAIALPITGQLLLKYKWAAWFPSMVVFGIIGGCAMLFVMRKQRLMKEAAERKTLAAVAVQ